jgi:hypothetical protein
MMQGEIEDCGQPNQLVIEAPLGGRHGTGDGSPQRTSRPAAGRLALSIAAGEKSFLVRDVT